MKTTPFRSINKLSSTGVTRLLIIGTLLSAVSCVDKKDEAELDAMLSWKFDSNTVPNYSLSQEEIHLNKQLLNITEKNDIKICYGIEAPTYFFEHVLPLYNAMPGPFCGLANSKHSENIAATLVEKGYEKSNIFMFNTLKTLQKFADNEKHLMIAAAWTTDHHLLKLTHISHGVDEDKVFYEDKHISPESRPEKDFSLVFTKFNSISRQFTNDEIREYYQIDKSKKTILVITTFGDSFLDKNYTPTSILEKALTDLSTLKLQYNLIIRPHPLASILARNKLKESGFIIAPNGKFSSFVPLFEISDLIIADVGASSAAATYHNNIPLILFRLNKSFLFKGKSFAETAEHYKDLVHSEKTCVLINEDNFDLIHAVNEAFTKDGKATDRITARKRYFDYWYGCNDGYENYRLAFRLLAEKGIDITSLQREYSKLPLYNGRPLCSSDSHE